MPRPHLLLLTEFEGLSKPHSLLSTEFDKLQNSNCIQGRFFHTMMISNFNNNTNNSAFDISVSNLIFVFEFFVRKILFRFFF